MDAIAQTPIDFLTWGSHEADIDHKTVCKHFRQFPGTWINRNMQAHDMMQCQVPYEIVNISSPDGSHTRRFGLVAVLSDDPKLYSHFKPPGAFWVGRRLIVRGKHSTSISEFWKKKKDATLLYPYNIFMSRKIYEPVKNSISPLY